MTNKELEMWCLELLDNPSSYENNKIFMYLQTQIEINKNLNELARLIFIDREYKDGDELCKK